MKRKCILPVVEYARAVDHQEKLVVGAAAAAARNLCLKFKSGSFAAVMVAAFPALLLMLILF